MKMIVKSIAWYVKEPEQYYLHPDCGHNSLQIIGEGGKTKE